MERDGKTEDSLIDFWIILGVIEIVNRGGHFGMQS